ncbi:MAG TPA: ATP-binding protein [Stellaceae bacterium]|nr:ATP-binding protein [Stellaceae bacterium]
MSSSRIESAAVARDAGGPSAAATPSLELDNQSWVKRVLPRTMFGRSLLIVLMPLVLLQAIATWIFYDRHWAAISWRLANGVASNVGLLIEATRYAATPADTARLLERAGAMTDLRFTLEPKAHLSPPPPPSGTLLESQLRIALQQRLAFPYRIDAVSRARAVMIDIQLPQGVLAVVAPRDLLYSSTTYIFVLWMVGSSLVLLAVAILFLRNQVRSLRRLAAAADSFGKGRPVPFFKVEGAVEIRRAAVAFMTMRDRIERQIRQRTEMLAGVSHDLRTPLTRMKLALELVRPDAAVEELRSDVAEMEHMVNGYLDFVRGEGGEEPAETDFALLLDDFAQTMRREGTPLSLAAPPEYVIPVRPNAIRRCLANLVGNARRHGSHVWLTGLVVVGGIDIIVDDDGPGIAPADRERVFQPFIRLDPSRSPGTGGIGLGLTIARDVARGHGGEVYLETSPQGGLRARLHLPR